MLPLNELIGNLRHIQLRLDARFFEPAPGVEPLVRATIGDAQLYFSPNDTSPYPSSNRNRVQFLGIDGKAEAAMLPQIVELYRSREIERFFFWLSPSAQSEEIEGWLAQHGLQPFEGTGYPTLIRDAAPAAPCKTDLTVRRIDGRVARALKMENSGVLSSTPFASAYL